MRGRSRTTSTERLGQPVEHEARDLVGPGLDALIDLAGGERRRLGCALALRDLPFADVDRLGTLGSRRFSRLVAGRGIGGRRRCHGFDLASVEESPGLAVDLGQLTVSSTPSKVVAAAV